MKYSVMTGDLKDTSSFENDMMMPTLLGGEAKIRINKYKNDQVATYEEFLIR